MLYTRKGDTGTTKLFHCKQGERLSKSSVVFEVLGNVDELNSVLGYAKSLCKDTNDTLYINGKNTKYEDILEKVQQYLFSLQRELGSDEFYIKKEHTYYLEEIISEVESFLPPITSFIVPGGGKVASYLDICRTVARRAERSLIHFSEKENQKINEFSLIFINRLSSVLYALARFANYQEGYTESSPNYTHN